MREAIPNIGLEVAREDIRSLAAGLRTPADKICGQWYEKTLDELTLTEATNLRLELVELISQQGESMSAQTNTGTAAQPQKAAEIPNTEAYSTNFYFDMQVEGQTFAGQMTVRGGLNGPDHLHRVLGAMKVVVQSGGVAKGPRGQQAPASQSNGNSHSKKADSGEPWEFVSEKGKMVVQVNWG